MVAEPDCRRLPGRPLALWELSTDGDDRTTVVFYRDGKTLGQVVVAEKRGVGNALRMDTIAVVPQAREGGYDAVAMIPGPGVEPFRLGHLRPVGTSPPTGERPSTQPDRNEP